MRQTPPWVGLLLFLSTAWLGCQKIPAAAAGSNNNVIVITLDGVRWREVFGLPDSNPLPDGSPLSHFWNHSAQEAVIIKNATTAQPSNVSLPGYMSLFGGFDHTCRSNECDFIELETIQERVHRELDLSSQHVAVVSSWDRIERAVRTKGSPKFLINTGFVPFPGHNTLNERQKEEGTSSENTRWDASTWAHSMEYLKDAKPRFFYISLNDSDEWAHRGQWDHYLAILKTYDLWIHELVHITLPSMGEYGANTTVIVTTDHGRGRDHNWRHHGAGYEEADQIWLFAMGPKIRGSNPTQKYSHLNVRPTIELLLGLCPNRQGYRQLSDVFFEFAHAAPAPIAEIIENSSDLPQCE